MLFGLLKSEPPLDEDSRLWLFDAFGWSLRQFDAGFFRDQTILVLPSNRHFPGRVDSAHGMAELVFRKVCEYAGMQHWPLRLAPPGSCPAAGPARLTVSGALRGEAGSVSLASADDSPVELGYDPGLVGNPGALIADFAHTLAGILATTTSEPPPGDAEAWPHATEIVAVFMGFGVMLANSAKTIQVHNCGSCGGGRKNRRSFLSQWDITYALALFCTLKGLGGNTVLPALDKPLRPFFKRAMKDIAARPRELAPLQALI